MIREINKLQEELESADTVIEFEKNLNPKEMIFSYSNGYLIGKTGLEYTYDDLIRGRFGKKIFEVDASGKFLNELRVVDAINGKDLFTSLDLESQKVAYEQLNRRRGAVVAVDINTGAIVKYLSSPSFSVNKIANGMTQKEFKLLINDDDKPFFDRAAQGRYSPASTIKPAIALFGIENNIIDKLAPVNDISQMDDRVNPVLFQIGKENIIIKQLEVVMKMC